MKRFSEYLNEDFDPAIYNSDGAISIKDPTVLDAINSNLEVSTSCVFRTPYNALEEIRKVLAYYKIFLPKGVFLDQNHGNDVFEVSQFGEKMGMNNDGEVVTASDSPLFVYFEWSLNEKGMYDVFAALVDQDELDEILADYEAEIEDDETDLQEQHSIGKVSKMLYKVVNQAKASKQSDDVDSLINHEKQGKTFTQANEEAMPDLKKKMGAKKVTLPNMMRKEEALDEVSQKRAISAYASANDPSYTHPKADKILRQIKRKFGQKASDSAEDHAYASHFGRKYSSGSDSLKGGLRNYLSKDTTKAGKVKSSTVKGMKANVKSRKVGGPKGQLPEETQLNELRGKGSVDKEDLKKHIIKKHDDAWVKTKNKRQKNKSSGPADTRDEDKHRDRLGRMYNKLEEDKRKFDTAKAFAEVPAKEKKTPATSAYRAVRKLARKAKKEKS